MVGEKFVNESLIARVPSIYLVSAGSCGACELELAACFGPDWNLERWGVNWVDHPSRADLLLLVGCLNGLDLQPIVDAVPKPHWIVAMGACALSGGIFHEEVSFVPADERVRVDLVISGCPPRPAALFSGLNKLLTFIKQRKR
jgi:Ni,Fe-hydrogenase III small subunit